MRCAPIPTHGVCAVTARPAHGTTALPQDASSYERTKALIDKYDPDARKVQPAPPPGIMTVRHHAHGQQQGAWRLEWSLDACMLGRMDG